MRYAIARLNIHRRDMACRYYFANSLQLICKNAGEGASYLTHTLEQVLHYKPDNRTGDEIAADVLSKITGGDSSK